MVNPRCEVLKSEYGQLPLEELLNLEAFSLDRMEEVVAEAVEEAKLDEKNAEELKCRPAEKADKPFDFMRGNKGVNTGGSFMLFGPDGKLTPSARQITPGHSDFVNTVTITVEGEVILDAFNNWVAKFLNSVSGCERAVRFDRCVTAILIVPRFSH